MRHARLVRTVAVLTAAALLALPTIALAEDTGTPPPTNTITPAPTDPTAAPEPAPVIVVRSYRTTPERVLVGSTFDLTVEVYNATYRRAENVVVSLGAPAQTAAAGAATAGGLTVLGTGNAKYLGTLKGQLEDLVTFKVMAAPGTTPGAVALPVTVSFEWEGARQEVGYTIGLVVERDASLALITAEVPESAMQGETFNASFEVANASAFALSGVTLSVEASGATVTDSTMFLGTMDAAGTEAIDVTVTPKKPGPLEVTAVVTYRDDFGRTQTFRESRTVNVQATASKDEQSSSDAAPAKDKKSENWLVKFFKSLFGLGS